MDGWKWEINRKNRKKRDLVSVESVCAGGWVCESERVRV